MREPTPGKVWGTLVPTNRKNIRGNSCLHLVVGSETSFGGDRSKPTGAGVRRRPSCLWRALVRPAKSPRLRRPRPRYGAGAMAMVAKKPGAPPKPATQLGRLTVSVNEGDVRWRSSRARASPHLFRKACAALNLRQLGARLSFMHFHKLIKCLVGSPHFPEAVQQSGSIFRCDGHGGRTLGKVRRGSSQSFTTHQTKNAV